MLARSVPRGVWTILLVVALSAQIFAQAAAAQDEPHLYVFSMPGCRPCRQMEPDVDRLIQAGYPVSKVDCTTNEAWAKHFQITQTPTIILTVGQQVAARSMGPQNYDELVRLFDGVGYRPKGTSTARDATPNTATISHLASQTSLAPTRAPEATTASDPSASTPPMHLAHQATIRIKVEDPKGTSYATGTVIHRHGDEYLAITCGHVFRESQGTGTITVETGFADGQPEAARGQILKYDANARDVGLIAFHSTRPIEPIKIAPAQLPISPGAQVFSFGCDHGQNPTRRDTQILRSAIYDGATKYDIAGRPVDGRSGGGLFSAGGQLIGICNAAAVEVDEGVYTSLENIYWQLDQAQLAHLFQAASVTSTPTIASNDTPERLDVRTPPAEQKVAGDVEIIMVVRSKSNPALAETYTVQQPTPQLLGLVQSIRSAEAGTTQTASLRDSALVPVTPSELDGHASEPRLR